MTFIDELFECGGHYIIERTEEGASLTPAGTKDADMESFQHLVRRVRANAGKDFDIKAEHRSDGPGSPVDLMLLTLEAGTSSLLGDMIST